MSRSSRRSEGKLRAEVSKRRDTILLGRLLVLDPSCGSRSSMPGYAIYSAGKLVENGIIELPLYPPPLHCRLQALARCLREDFEVPDLLVVEAIPVRAYGRRRSSRSQASLLQSVGAIVSNVEADHVVYVPPQTWHAYVGEGHEKSDENDAKAMGDCVIAMANNQF